MDSITNIQNQTAIEQSKAKAQTGGSTELDNNAFLQLLMAQMKSQDPLNPMDSSQFLSQSAQFTQIQELQKLNKSVSSSNGIMQASSLIGKNVSLSDPNNSKHTISGIVNEARVDSAGASVVINGQPYPLNNLISIKEANVGS